MSRHRIPPVRSAIHIERIVMKQNNRLAIGNMIAMVAGAPSTTAEIASSPSQMQTVAKLTHRVGPLRQEHGDERLQTVISSNSQRPPPLDLSGL